MRIHYMSDLHLEVNPGFRAQPLPGADVLVLVGDVGSYQERSGLVAQPRDWGLAQFATRAGRNSVHRGGWPYPVLYVPGNHEFDGLDFEEASAHLHQICDELGIVWLNEQVHRVGDVRFIGHVLWSDFDALATVPGYKVQGHPNALTRQLSLREKAFRAANHHISRFHALRGGEPILAEGVRDQSLAAQAWLSAQLQQPHPAGPSGKTVVATHFAPSLRSADPRYGIQPGTAGFCNALDELIPLADVWLHGHLHCPSHYQVGADPSKGHVRANPLGYAGNHEQQHFNPQAWVDV